MTTKTLSDWGWESPSPLGIASAIDSAGSVAAPLLAGFSFTLVALILPDTTKFELPGLTLALLAGAAVSFIATVQCSFWARQYAITPSDIQTWHPDYESVRQVALQKAHQRLFMTWVGRSNRTYRAAILMLLAGVGIALAPKGSLGPARGLAIGIVALGFALELMWILAGWVLYDVSDMAFAKAPASDEPVARSRTAWLRKSRPLVWFARLVIPCVVVKLPPQDSVAALEKGQKLDN